MEKIELLVPRMGEGIVEVSIIKWLKKEGESFNSDEPLVELATDKVDSELPAPYSGIIDKFLVNEGENALIGSPLAILKIKSSINKEHIIKETKLIDNLGNKNNFNKTSIRNLDKYKSKNLIKNKKYSPLVINIAKSSGLDISELDKIYGSAKGGRIIKEDIINYLKSKNKSNLDTNNNYNISISPGDKEIKLNRIRKVIAQKMVLSNKEIPHVSSFVEADITELAKWRLKVKTNFLKKNKAPLTFTPIFLWTIARALKEYPLINSYFSGDDTLIQKKNINIGLAVSIEENNLLIPVIKKADQLSLTELALESYNLIEKARNKKLKPEDITEATYSVSNIGVFNTLMGTPMITPPQVAVMAIGVIKKVPALNKETNKIEERDKIILSHSYDHRIIDGALGGLFANKVASLLESFPIDSLNNDYTKSI